MLVPAVLYREDIQKAFAKELYSIITVMHTVIPYQRLT